MLPSSTTSRHWSCLSNNCNSSSNKNNNSQCTTRRLHKKRSKSCGTWSNLASPSSNNTSRWRGHCNNKLLLLRRQSQLLLRVRQWRQNTISHDKELPGTHHTNRCLFRIAREKLMSVNETWDAWERKTSGDSSKGGCASVNAVSCSDHGFWVCVHSQEGQERGRDLPGSLVPLHGQGRPFPVTY